MSRPAKPSRVGGISEDKKRPLTAIVDQVVYFYFYFYFYTSARWVSITSALPGMTGQLPHPQARKHQMALRS
jgi:hypothetical protein